MNKHTFLNPDFMPPHADEEYVKEHRASQKAYMVWSLIHTARLAQEASDTPDAVSGVGVTLEIAGHIAGDLIDGCEMLEKRRTLEAADNQK